MKTHGYIRVSTNTQAESKAGLEAQRAAIMAFLGGIEPDHWHEDAGYHGDTLDRPALHQMLDDLKAGDVVIVAKRDRLSREMFLGLWLEKEIIKHKAALKSCEGGNGAGSQDKLMKNIMMAFAEFERHVIGERTKAALKARKVSGCALGAVPYGWQSAGTGVDRRFVPVEDQQSVLQRILKMDSAGMTAGRIAKALTSDRIPTKKGKGETWNTDTVRKIIIKAKREKGEAK